MIDMIKKYQKQKKMNFEEHDEPVENDDNYELMSVAQQHENEETDEN